MILIIRKEVIANITSIKDNKYGELDKLNYYKDKYLVVECAKTSVESTIAGFMGKI